MKSLHRIIGARLPRRPLLWDLELADGKIENILPHDLARSDSKATDPGVLNADGRLVAPSLCHAHIHLDKCFLLQDLRYIELQIESGDFKEAMTMGKVAKERMTEKDLSRRGGQLITESIDHGVTAMRAFVEVDPIVGITCLEAGLKLKAEFAGRIDIQICAFAQLPLFSGDDGGDQIRRMMTEAAKRDGVDVVGSTPYVEDDESKSRENIDFIVGLALDNDKMLDLHLDYHLEREKEPMIWHLIQTLKQKRWPNNSRHHITIGHCTRITFFSEDDWKRLRKELSHLPVSFVGLPTSDLFMMRTDERYRGTLPIPEMIKKHGLQAAIAVNNIGNAFTPQGNADPLSVASLGIGLYSAGTIEDAELLYDCVSERAKHSVGEEMTAMLDLAAGQPADLVIFPLDKCPWRTRTSISQAVYDPCPGRTCIRGGQIVSQSAG